MDEFSQKLIEPDLIHIFKKIDLKVNYINKKISI